MGKYCCFNCDWSVTLGDDSDPLPPCGKCDKAQATTFYECEGSF